MVISTADLALGVARVGVGVVLLLEVRLVVEVQVMIDAGDGNVEGDTPLAETLDGLS